MAAAEQQQHLPTRPRPGVPRGFHFRPTPEELIGGYLDPWVTGQPLDGGRDGIVLFADVYGRDPPAALTERFRNSGHHGHWYFFSVNKWPAARYGDCVDARPAWRRVDGGGAWHHAGGEGNIFEYRDAENKKTAWRMEEFASGLDAATGIAGEKVICMVYLSPETGTLEPDDGEAITGAADVACSGSDAGSTSGATALVVWRQPTPESSTDPDFYCRPDDVAIRRGSPDDELSQALPLTALFADGEVMRFDSDQTDVDGSGSPEG